MAEQEGVIKYRLDFTPAEILRDHDYAALNHWHRQFKRAAILGQDPGRYDGLGFGNLSQRLHGEQFLISGTQTGHLDELKPEHYAIVTRADISQNRIFAQGPIRPSSESLTHAAIYALNPDITFVFHGHSPDVWLSRKDLSIPETAETVPYGTPAMATEMKRLYDEYGMRDSGIIAMAGHEDGVISFGASADQAGDVMMAFLQRATG